MENMKNRNLKQWLQKAGIRAIKTMAQAAIAGIGAAAALGEVDWRYVVSASVLAGVLSLLTSTAGIPEVPEVSENTNNIEETEKK
jgi:nucleoside permease NupC